MTQEFIVTGRIVWGNPAQARDKTDVRTKQPKLDASGKKIQVWNFGVAIPKAEFGTAYAAMQREAATVFPNGVPQNFAWKFKDGDGPNPKGGMFSEKEGWAGCCVLTVSTEAFAPQIYKFENNAYHQLPPDAIKCGDYVAVKITCKFNGATSPNTPGLYINPNGIVLVGYGTQIVSGQDPDEMFAGYNFGALPAGASATPVLGAAPLPVGMTPNAGGYPAAPVAPAYGVPPAAPVYGAQPGYPQPVAAMPPPAHDFVRNAGGYPAAPVAPAYGVPPAAPVYGAQPGNYPAANAGHAAQQPSYPGMVPAGNAGPVTAYPSNGMPGIPQGR